MGDGDSHLDLCRRSSVSTVAATYAAVSTAVASDEYLQMKKEEKIKASK
jgi:hypothetical protein